MWRETVFLHSELLEPPISRSLIDGPPRSRRARLFPQPGRGSGSDPETSTKKKRRAVAEVCRCPYGIPLAIEFLAVVRTIAPTAPGSGCSVGRSASWLLTGPADPLSSATRSSKRRHPSVLTSCSALLSSGPPIAWFFLAKLRCRRGAGSVDLEGIDRGRSSMP